MIRRPPSSPPFPYTTLFRSRMEHSAVWARLSHVFEDSRKLCTPSSIDRKSTRLNSSHSQISFFLFFFFNDTATTEFSTLSLHDALPISHGTLSCMGAVKPCVRRFTKTLYPKLDRSEEHTSELQSQSNLLFSLFFF